MTEEATTLTQDISLLRAQIDTIDAKIAHLLVRRTEISQAVAFSKNSDAINANLELSFGWRPKREIEILRHIRQVEPSLGKRLSYMVWRAMITRNLASQAAMEVICVKQSEAASRIGFGAAVVPRVVENCDFALQFSNATENLILSLPWPDENQNWWLRLLEPQYSMLKINMALPHIDDREPEALCLARIEPIETLNDYSLVATNNPETQFPINSDAELISSANGYCLWRLRGFHANLSSKDPSVYFLGSYAIV
jgi:chorismate mutase